MSKPRIDASVCKLLTDRESAGVLPPNPYFEAIESTGDDRPPYGWRSAGVLYSCGGAATGEEYAVAEAVLCRDGDDPTEEVAM